jgi:hypothetical protein
MNKKYILNLMPKINDSGQVLLIITIALATLLGIGISVSNQTLSSISRTSQTDSLQKVTAAAEGGLEKYMLITDSSLENKVGEPAEVKTFSESKTQAKITVDRISAGDTGLTFPEVAVNQVANFFFSNDISSQTFTGQKTCLKITTDTPNPNFMMNVVVKNSTVTTFQPTTPAAVVNYDATTSNNFLMEKYINKDGSFVNAAPEPYGTNSYCFTNAALLRIHPLTETLRNLKIEVVGTSGTSNLKSVTQGYKIISIGEFTSSDDKTTRKITASKFRDAPSHVFDYTAFIDY